MTQPHASQTHEAARYARSTALADLLSIVDRLREPDGCPWDRKQTVESMARYVIEEGHELVEAIDRGADGPIAEEAGDLLMVLMMICRIASEEGRFDVRRAAEAVSDKLVRRHPHVFGDATADTPDQVLRNWEEIKRAEREEGEVDSSAMAGVPKSLPALQRAERTCEKAVAAGFRWQDARGALDKLHEEVGELQEVLTDAALESEERPRLEGELRARIEHELGDVLLAGAFLAHYLRLEPERCCRQAIQRFEDRFRAMEEVAEGPVGGRDVPELIRLWERAKAASDPRPPAP